MDTLGGSQDTQAVVGCTLGYSRVYARARSCSQLTRGREMHAHKLSPAPARAHLGPSLVSLSLSVVGSTKCMCQRGCLCLCVCVLVYVGVFMSPVFWIYQCARARGSLCVRARQCVCMCVVASSMECGFRVSVLECARARRFVCVHGLVRVHTRACVCLCMFAYMCARMRGLFMFVKHFRTVCIQ